MYIYICNSITMHDPKGCNLPMLLVLLYIYIYNIMI